MNLALWIVQGLLSAAFLAAGAMKLFAYEKYRKQAEAQSPGKGPGISKGLAAFIGLSELAGGVGLILPQAMHIAPVLTPLAALGLVIIMVLAIVFHIRRKEPATHAMALLVLALFVAVGRGLN